MNRRRRAKGARDSVRVPISRNRDVVTGRILDAAEAEFKRAGYERANTEDMRLSFGGSKATLFRHFPAKQLLFSAVVSRIASRWRSKIVVPVADEDRPREWLIAFGIQTLEWLLSDDLMFVGKIGISEGHHSPETKDVFASVVTVPLEDILARRLAYWRRGGLLKTCVPKADARRFLDLTVSGPVSLAHYGHARMHGAELKKHVEERVSFFLRAVGEVTIDRQKRGGNKRKGSAR